MLKSKLWHNKTEKKKMIAKMVELVKTYDQYPRKLNFGHFFSSIILTPLSWGEIDFQKMLFGWNG